MLGAFYNAFFPLRALRDAFEIFFRPQPFLNKVVSGETTVRDGVEYVASVFAFCGLMSIFSSNQYSNIKCYDLVGEMDEEAASELYDTIVNEFCIKPYFEEIETKLLERKESSHPLSYVSPYRTKPKCGTEMGAMIRNLFTTGSDDISKSIRTTIGSIEASDVIGYLEGKELLHDPAPAYKALLRAQEAALISEIVGYALLPFFFVSSVFFVRFVSPKYLEIDRSKLSILTLYVVGSGTLFANTVDTLTWAMTQSGGTVDFVVASAWTVAYFAILYRPIGEVFGLSLWPQVRMFHVAVALVYVIVQIILAAGVVILMMTTFEAT